MRFTKKYLIPAGVAVLALAVAGCAPTGESGNNDGGDSQPVAVSLITSETGPLAAYAEQFIGGFNAGWDYITDGTGEIDGREVTITISDDGGDPDKAVGIIKDEIGKGTKIFTGTVSSGIALAVAEQADQNDVLYISGAAATDALTGNNENTFRSGRQTQQDVATAGTFLGDPSGKNIVVFAQDNAFGQSNVAGVDSVLGAKGATVSSILVPEDATEFTPFAQQLLQSDADLAFVAWAGVTTSAMWGSLAQQGVFDAIPVVTGLADVATYNAYGEVSDKISFLNHYFAGATDNAENQAMIEHLEAEGKVADIFSPDGFNAAVMIAEAIRTGGGDDVDAMIDALEGFSFQGPKGDMEVRASDHALLQDMFQARLVKDGDNWVPELIAVAPADEVAPAEVDMP
jgi:branched-chain amino acid transport system substrate-binding protein